MPIPRGKAAGAKFVMHEFKHGKLHTGSAKGPVVKSRPQAIAIMLHETGQSKGQQAGKYPPGRGRQTND